MTSLLAIGSNQPDPGQGVSSCARKTYARIACQIAKPTTTSETPQARQPQAQHLVAAGGTAAGVAGGTAAGTSGTTGGVAGGTAAGATGGQPREPQAEPWATSRAGQPPEPPAGQPREPSRNHGRSHRRDSRGGHRRLNRGTAGGTAAGATGVSTAGTTGHRCRSHRRDSRGSHRRLNRGNCGGTVPAPPAGHRQSPPEASPGRPRRVSSTTAGCHGPTTARVHRSTTARVYRRDATFDIHQRMDHRGSRNRRRHHGRVIAAFFVLRPDPPSRRHRNNRRQPRMLGPGAAPDAATPDGPCSAAPTVEVGTTTSPANVSSFENIANSLRLPELRCDHQRGRWVSNLPVVTAVVGSIRAGPFARGTRLPGHPPCRHTLRSGVFDVPATCNGVVRSSTMTRIGD